MEQVTYQTLRHKYLQLGITYKANQTLHKLTQARGYPYKFLLHICKFFHLNQFQVIFLSHILFQQQPSYNIEPDIFQQNNCSLTYPIIYTHFSNQPTKSNIYSIKQLTNIYTYLMVVGYSVKYYLNQSIKPYQDELKKSHNDFLIIFNNWASKYGTKALKTNPRRINSFYISIFQNDQEKDYNAHEADCQYRNYNQIVEELIRATTQIDIPERFDEEQP